MLRGTVQLGLVEVVEEVVLDKWGFEIVFLEWFVLRVVVGVRDWYYFPPFLRGIVEGVLGQSFLAWPSLQSLLFKFTVVSIVSSVCPGVILDVEAGVVLLFLGTLWA